jgi:hypothetical protein
MTKADVEKIARRLAAGRHPTTEEIDELIQLSLAYLSMCIDGPPPPTAPEMVARRMGSREVARAIAIIERTRGRGA